MNASRQAHARHRVPAAAPLCYGLNPRKPSNRTTVHKEEGDARCNKQTKKEWTPTTAKSENAIPIWLNNKQPRIRNTMMNKCAGYTVSQVVVASPLAQQS